MEAEMAQEVLDERCAERRLQMLIAFMESEIELIRTENEIQDRVKKQMDKNQREYYLREQIKIISEELGDGDSPAAEAEEYRKRIEMLALSDENAEMLLKECAKLSRMPFGSHEATVVRTYLDTCIALPWNVTTTDRIDVAAAEKILDRDHYGLKKVKERILELLAVRQLQPDVRGQILCLVGPPGVGKTSIARSVAQAMNRKYVRVSLGGVHDEAEIRGHRKTYIGAMPGRIMAAVKQAGSMNPLILLDEIDKLGGDFRGDPASALLEVLDPEQNVSFHDHYIDLPFDLSRALFITTANDEGAIPGPLRDRMEVIRIPGYTLEEKVHIALEHLYPNQLKKNGLDRRRVKLSEEALRGLIDGYTREAGVRNLERMLGSLCRKAARKIVSGETKTVKIGMEELEPMLGPALFTPDDLNTVDQVGVCNGLAWTAVGGEMLQVEVALMEGTGKLELTGSLGDVMKESARIAISCVRTLAPKLSIDGEFYKKLDIHIHVPEGAVPKDGPSAGVTLTTALVSALTDNPVRGDVAMTGEVTLRGRVLPIGGLREKAMAAYTHKMKTVLIPKGNAPHVAEVDEAVKAGLEFVPVESILQVLQTALVHPVGAPQNEGK
jgi:ATP-dependent Lon protease